MFNNNYSSRLDFGLHVFYYQTSLKRITGRAKMEGEFLI